MDHVFREVEPLVSVVGRVLRLLVRAEALDDPLNVLAAQVLSGYAIQPLPQARHESPGETPVVGGPVGCRCQHLEPQGTLQLAHPVRGCRQRPDTREAGVDQDDQSVQAGCRRCCSLTNWTSWTPVSESGGSTPSCGRR